MVFIFNITSNSLKFSDIKIYFWWLNKKSLTMSWCSAGFEAILRHIYIPFIFISLLYPNNISNFSSRKLGSFLVLFSSLSPPDKFLDKYTLVHLFTHLYFLYLWLYLLEFFVFCFFFCLIRVFPPGVFTKWFFVWQTRYDHAHLHWTRHPWSDFNYLTRAVLWVVGTHK